MPLSDEQYAVLTRVARDEAELPAGRPDQGQVFGLLAIADRLDAVRGEVARLADVFEEAGK